METSDRLVIQNTVYASDALLWVHEYSACIAWDWKEKQRSFSQMEDFCPIKHSVTVF